MSFILDCESQKSAIETLSTGFNCNEKTLIDVLSSIDLDAIYKAHWRDLDVPSDTYLYNYVIENIGQHKKLTAVNWFHCTRTIDQNKFIDGIKPLNNIIDDIWLTLIKHAPDDLTRKKLINLQINGVDDYQYSLKTNGSIHWGPYAILIREVAFNATRLAQHDYLAMPEIIEDICNGFNRQYGVDIYKYYNSVLVPKLVKFTSDKRLDEGCIEAALCYTHNTIKYLPIDGNSITCFNNNGLQINRAQIISVETVSP